MDIFLYAVLALLTLTLVVAAFCDLTRYTLPNEISWLVFGLFLITALSQLSFSLLALHLASGLIVFVVTFIKWHLRIIYGGDVKLWTATAFWFELSKLPHQLLAVILIGGVLTLGMVAVRHGLALYVRKAGHEGLQAHVPEIFRVGGHVPYGFAIAMGTLWALLTTAPGFFETVLPGWPEGSPQFLISKLVMIFFR